MRTLIIVATACLSLCGPAVAQERSGPRSAAARHDIERILPPNWRIAAPQRRVLGRRYVSPDGSAWLTIQAQPTRRDGIVDHMASVAQRPGERVTYVRRGRGWIVSSGYRGGRIFYRKAMLACGNRAWHEIAFEYPAEEKRAFDRLVTRVSGALKAYGRDGCEPE